MKISILTLFISAMIACIALWVVYPFHSNIECGFVDDISSLESNGDYVLGFKINNKTPREILISGFGAGCGDNCCIEVRMTFPMKIPAKSEVILDLPVHTRGDPDYHLSTFLYITDDGNIIPVPVTISRQNTTATVVSHGGGAN